RMPGGVAIRLAIADEDDRPAGSLVREHPGALAGAADETRRMTVRELDPGAAVLEGRAIGDHGQVRQAARDEGRPQGKAEPVAADLDGDPGRLCVPDERDEAGVVRLRCG